MNKKQTTASDFLNRRLHDAIGFALNWPTDWELIKHDLFNKVYKVRYMDGGWYHLDLNESLVRNCMKHQGHKSWTEPTDYEDIFSRTHAAAERWKETDNG